MKKRFLGLFFKNLPQISKKTDKKLRDLYERLFGKDVRRSLEKSKWNFFISLKKAAANLDIDLDVLANIDESELEDLLHDPDFLNMDPNLPPEERRRLIEEIR